MVKSCVLVTRGTNNLALTEMNYIPVVAAFSVHCPIFLLLYFFPAFQTQHMATDPLASCRKLLMVPAFRYVKVNHMKG